MKCQECVYNGKELCITMRNYFFDGKDGAQDGGCVSTGRIT